MFEPVYPAHSHVAIFGAGHVGRALVSLLGGLRVRVTWVDSRAEALVDAPAGVTVRHVADPALEAAALPSGTIVLVMTHDHQIDFDIIAASLPRADFTAVGLIGSETKRARFVRRLNQRGIPTDTLICPIGIPGAGGKLPAEIAISVAAQILQIQQRTEAAKPLTPIHTECADCARECTSREATA
jgi:xanthine dehydrogenase accessory factor